MEAVDDVLAELHAAGYEMAAAVGVVTAKVADPQDPFLVHLSTKKFPRL